MVPARSSCVLTIDVEDWFHILDLPSAPGITEWDSLPSRVEQNFMRLLDLAAENSVRCTCFFLGWVAKRYPRLVVSAANLGHEIASHGWAHRLVHELTADEFQDDALLAKDTLEQITGRRVLGYRAAGFSLTGDCEWVFDELLRAGYVYDSSVFPAPRAHGGWQTGRYAPYEVQRPEGSLLEFPMTVNRVLGRPFCFLGGGYLRLFPLALVRKMANDVLGEDRPAIFYVHPREIDPGQPRLPMNPWRHFKTYVNLHTTEKKLRYLLANFDFATFEDLAGLIAPQPFPAEPYSRIASI